MKFNLEYYRAFFMTANFLSFTKAAQHLFLTQSAVSQSVKKLEAGLDCPLFLRTPQGLQLTKEGRVLYTHVKRAFEELQTGERLIMKLAELHAGELQIGATETSLRFLLAPLIQRFKDTFPAIQITFIGSTTRDTCKRLSCGDIEIALLLSPIPPEFHFELTKIYQFQDIFIASRGFPVDPHRVYPIEELADFPMVSIGQENSMRSFIDNWFLEHDILFVPEYTVNSTGLVLPLVKKNLGIGILPSHFVSEDLKEGSIFQVRTTCLPPPRDTYLAVNPSSPVSAIGQAFIRFIQENITTVLDGQKDELC